MKPAVDELFLLHRIAMKAAKPRAEKRLLSTLHALFRQQFSDQKVMDLFRSLCKKGLVKVDGARISYALPVGD
jgi:hypothetical protein